MTLKDQVLDWLQTYETAGAKFMVVYHDDTSVEVECDNSLAFTVVCDDTAITVWGYEATGNAAPWDNEREFELGDFDSASTACRAICDYQIETLKDMWKDVL